MLSITSDMRERQGLDPNKWYEAFVVNNDDRTYDGKMFGRIQARIKTLFDGVSDANLPWAIPHWNHIDGATPISGLFSVPKVGSKVFLKFQDGNPAFPMYRGYHVDATTQMEEIKFHYPNRAVARFSNKALLVVDTEDNVAYLRNPGNLKIFVDGNVALEINGNVDELIHGNVRRRIKGNLDEEVDGYRHYHTSGNVTAVSEANIRQYSGGSTLLESGSDMKIEGGPMILENCGNAQGNPGRSKKPVFEKWPGIPGSAKGTNTRGTPTMTSAGQPSQNYAADATPPTRNGHISNGPEVEPGSYS